jgi:GntR family transcriptional regulator/MocR family aminotransferase
VAWLPGDLDEATVVAAAARHGVVVQGVTPYRLRPAGPGGLIFGYATLTERAITDGVAALADAVAEVRGPTVGRPVADSPGPWR